MKSAYLHSLKVIDEMNISINNKKKLHGILHYLAFNSFSATQESIIDEQDLPGSLILGGVEILVGSLIHIIPGCNWIGRLIIADGVRRTFNGLEVLDEHNRSTYSDS